MKKYLMMTLAAALVVSCSKMDDVSMSQSEIDQAKYDAAFINHFGNPASNQDWGFGSTSNAPALTRAASAGSTVATTNATLFNDWSDQKTYVTCDEGEAVEYQVTYSSDASHPVIGQLDVLKAYSEVLPEGQNNTSKIATTNKEEFVTTAAGEISYIVLPGVTAGTNDRIGYYYYTTSCNIKTLHKYVLTNDPSTGYKGDGNYVDFKDENGNYLYTGWEKKFKSFKLVYVDENGNASYTFPAGVNVGFFTQTVEAGSQQTVELYSRGSLNQEISEWIGSNSTDGAGWANSATTSHAVIFSYEGYNFVGFEDWYDYDYNDMVLSVVGNITPAPSIIIDEDPDEPDEPEFTPVIRVMAEDLSATESSDFDFNDVVFDVMWIDGGARIRVVAAGGTLPLTVGGVEVHEKFGVSTKTMVNTWAGHKSDYAYAIFDIQGSFNGNANNILVQVEKNGEWQTLKAERGTPACKIGVDPNVDWADEKQDVDDKWNGQFSEWVQGKRETFY